MLIRRYKENRRKHPLADENVECLALAVEKERKMLEKIHFMADYVIDTSYISIAQLKVKLSDIFFGNVSNVLKIQCKSFGFKYGIPSDSDIVMDVRFLPNPYYDVELRPKTGNDKEIQDFVMKYPEATEFIDKLEDFTNYVNK